MRPAELVEQAGDRLGIGDDAAAIRERRRLLSPCLAAPSGIPGWIPSTKKKARRGAGL
jgi:hypothetical protein